MDIREFPVLTDEDQRLVDRLSTGLGEDAARVLAYLLGRLEADAFDRTATLTAIHIGTGLSRTATRECLRRLERTAVIDRTTVETATPGRPPTAWHAVAPREETIRRVDNWHATRLLQQGLRFDEPGDEGPVPTDGQADGDRETRGDERRSNPTSKADPAGDRITVGLNWRPNGFHLPLFAAETDGSAAETPIDFRTYAGSSAAARAVAESDVDVGVAGAATVLYERARGLAIVPVAVLLQRSTVVLYTTREAFGEPFEGIEQLRGRRLGTPHATETALLGRLLLEQADVGDAVEVVELDGEERDALRAGTVDVVTGMVPDARRLARDGHSVDVVSLADQYPAYGQTLITTREAVQRDRDRSRLERFLAATTAGWATATRAPAAADAAVSAIAARSNESPERVVRTFRLASERFGSSDAVRKRGWGWHTPDDWHALRAALAQGGVLAVE
ncbi:ABC transporter substrate-binding protein [Halopiger djelfimassiliensis]|uniref:ABC transporter substrate-binding protein n=1 Tax=Halopiger djelfimassiliensis TaxID=1293047 RepID=UPI0006775DBB|nr:ABC transporter substrate-binding protein [Halopiger djelfimassiliensis]